MSILNARMPSLRDKLAGLAEAEAKRLEEKKVEEKKKVKKGRRLNK